jgi:hypothetical protein
VLSFGDAKSCRADAKTCLPFAELDAKGVLSQCLQDGACAIIWPPTRFWEDEMYKPCQHRNSGEAYQRFHRSATFSGTHRFVVAALRHKLTGAIIALMAAAGVVGWWTTFSPFQ